jgi:hypothetical protein
VAEEAPQLFRVEELLPDTTVGENRFSRARGLSIFGPKLTLPVRELTDSQVQQFYWVLLYRTLSWGERTRVAPLSPVEKLKAVFGSDIVAIVDGFFEDVKYDEPSQTHFASTRPWISG